MNVRTQALVVLVALLVVMAGCASAPGTDSGQQATHYWESSAQASTNRYRVDNLACQSQTQADKGTTVFEPGSSGFDAYRDCMVSRGYVLRQY